MAKRWIVVVLTAMSCLFVTAMSASADSTSGCGYAIGGVQQQCAGAEQGVPAPLQTGNNVDVTCTAISPAGANVQATAVNCYIENYARTEIHYSITQTTNGDASTLVATFDASTLGSNNYFLCVRAGYIDAIGNFHAPTKAECNPLQLPGPLGETNIA